MSLKRKLSLNSWCLWLYNLNWLFDWHASPLLGELVGRSEHLPGNVHGPRQSRDSGGTENGQELAMYTIQCTLYNVHCIMDTIQWTLYSRGLSINPKFLKKLQPPIFVFVLSCWFQNSFSFLNFQPRLGVAVKFDPPPLNHKGPLLWWKIWKFVGLLI